MKLSDKNKKVLEEALNCTIIEFDRKNFYKIEYYNLQFAHKTSNLYCVDGCYTLTDTTLFDIIKSCNKLVVLEINSYCIDFVFLNDLNSIDI